MISHQIAVPRSLLMELADCLQLAPEIPTIKDPEKRQAAKRRCDEAWTHAIKILHPGALKGGK